MTVCTSLYRSHFSRHPVHHVHHAYAHSLVELLTVLAAIAALVALLVPVLGTSRRNAYTSLCMSNLKEFGQAHNSVMVRRTDGDRQFERRLAAPSNWASVLYDIDTLEEKFYCPEAETSDDKGDATESLMIAMTKKGDFNKVLYYQTLNEGDSWVRKLSWSQWLDATQGTGEFRKGGDFKQYFKNSYSGYVPDDEPERYVLMIEDYSGIQSGRWVNYTDFVVFVEKDPNNPTSALVNPQHGMLGSRDKGYVVWADNKKPVFEPNTYLERDDDRTASVVNAPGDYGANPNQIFSLRADSNRILFLDYEEAVATPNNWEDHYQDGKLSFTRHLNDSLNVAMVDGSVQNTREEKIRLSQFSKEMLYW